jgi:hypothetical protein
LENLLCLARFWSGTRRRKNWSGVRRRARLRVCAKHRGLDPLRCCLPAIPDTLSCCLLVAGHHNAAASSSLTTPGGGTWSALLMEEGPSSRTTSSGMPRREKRRRRTRGQHRRSGAADRQRHGLPVERGWPVRWLDAACQLPRSSRAWPAPSPLYTRCPRRARQRRTHGVLPAPPRELRARV